MKVFKILIVPMALVAIGLLTLVKFSTETKRPVVTQTDKIAVSAQAVEHGITFSSDATVKNLARDAVYYWEVSLRRVDPLDGQFRHVLTQVYDGIGYFTEVKKDVETHITLAQQKFDVYTPGTYNVFVTLVEDCAVTDKNGVLLQTSSQVMGAMSPHVDIQ